MATNLLRILLPLALAAGFWLLRGRHAVLTWGATAAEAAAALPGDELLPDPDGESTRAITIAAPPDAVWPWLVQIGPAPRGGAYTYDWIENLLGLEFHSADRILPEYQRPEPGTRVPFGSGEMIFARIDPERTLALLSGDGHWLWSFNLEPSAEGGTRLVSRNRYRLPSLRARVTMPFLEAGSLVMESGMLRGIRERAEALARGDSGSGPGDPPA